MHCTDCGKNLDCVDVRILSRNRWRCQECADVYLNPKPQGKKDLVQKMVDELDEVVAWIAMARASRNVDILALITKIRGIADKYRTDDMVGD